MKHKFNVIGNNHIIKDNALSLILGIDIKVPIIEKDVHLTILYLNRQKA